MGMFEFESLNEENKINRIEMPDGKKKTDELKKEYEGLCKSIKEVLGDKCEKVMVSNRLTDSPCCVVSAL